MVVILQREVVGRSEAASYELLSRGSVGRPSYFLKSGVVLS